MDGKCGLVAIQVMGSNPQIEGTCTFINDFQVEISSKGDIKGENSSTLCKNRKGIKDLSMDVNEC